jgi:putative nucleotidyltransferase with HDIG domain
MVRIASLAVRENNNVADIRQLIAHIDALQPIPPVAAKILDLAEDIKSCLSDIADVIIHDPSITANLLKICNSADFRLTRKVESIRDAIALLGIDQVVDLVLMDSLSVSHREDQDGYGLGEGELWRHAVISAHVAKTLAKKNGVAHAKNRVFTAALLKDIGKLILGRFEAFAFEKINILVQSHGYSFGEAENEVIGMNHETLGAMVAQNWQFDEKLVFMIQNHHLTDESAREDKETCLVYLADIVCMMMGMGTGIDVQSYRFYGEVLRRMGLTEKDLQIIIEEIGENWEKVESLIDFV